MTRSIHAACAGRLARRGDGRNDGAVGFAHRIWPAESAALAPIRREVERWLAPLDLPADVAADLVLWPSKTQHHPGAAGVIVAAAAQTSCAASAVGACSTSPTAGVRALTCTECRGRVER